MEKLLRGIGKSIGFILKGAFIITCTILGAILGAILAVG